MPHNLIIAVLEKQPGFSESWTVGTTFAAIHIDGKADYYVAELIR